jgi:hypothetical protein
MTTTRSTLMIAIALLAVATTSNAQLTASGTINGTLINKSGIALLFNSDPSGVTLGGAGTAAVTANFGTISAVGTLAAGVTRPAFGPTSFTVRTLFDVFVQQGGGSPSFNLTAALAAAAPTGFTYAINGTTLTTTAQSIGTTLTYNANVPQTLDLTVLTAAPGAGGPVVGTPVSSTINITAIAN